MTTITLIPAFKCKICNKKYYREISYNKHLLICNNADNLTPLLDSIINTTITEKTDVLPLRDIVMELVKSNNKLRKDVEKLKRYVQLTNNKINILELLNEPETQQQLSSQTQTQPLTHPLTQPLTHPLTQIPTQNYKEYMSNLVIKRKHLEIVFNSDLINGIQEIIENYIKEQTTINNIEILPFKSFDQKNDKIYVYNENNKWDILSSEDFNKMISIISKQILTEFNKWKDENEDKLYTDNFSPIFIQNTKKVIGNISLDKQRIKIHRNLYIYLKKVT